jgi:malonyl-CoA/methylmalonyl-CoA synthetase
MMPQIVSSPLSARLAALSRSTRTAIVDDRGETSFAELLYRARRAAGILADGAPGLFGARVALLATQDVDWVVAFLGTLLAGGVAVPLASAYPPAELAWFADDAGAAIAVVDEVHADAARALAAGRRLITPSALAGPEIPPADVGPGAPGLILYTSGTTGRPKGAVLSHANLATQAALLGTAWGLDAEDRLLHALPLHHLHGVSVALLNALLAGATVRMLPRFDAARVLEELERGPARVFMAVPTMYHRLREQTSDGARLRRATAALRLATSGSAALPSSLAEWWRGLTGAIPLERFGMTEIGIALSNPLDPGARRVGHVGLPLPTVETRLCDEHGADVAGPAELWVRGPSVFAGYRGRPEATAAAFTDGWFKTGDVAERARDGFVRLLGRTSVDILKSGGEKLSALEVEEAFREHPAVAEIAVVGLPDERWGDRVVAAIVARGACDPTVLRAWARERLAPHQVPRDIVLVEELPRNALGKVVKPELVRRLSRT